MPTANCNSKILFPVSTAEFERNTNAPLASIIVPCYNVAPWLTSAFRSVSNQTLGNYEVIAVDDGSTDGTSELLDKIAETDSRIQVIHTTNQGVASARQTGFNIASGKYITFLDPDDMLRPMYLQELVDIADSTNADVVVCAYSIFADPGIHLRLTEGRVRRARKEQDWDSNTVFSFPLKNERETIIVTNFIASDYFNAMWNKIYRKSFLNSTFVTFPQTTHGEDYIFNAIIFSHQPTFVLSPMRLYYYRVRTGAATQQPISRMISSTLLMIDAARTLAGSVPLSRDIVSERILAPLIGGMRRAVFSAQGKNDLSEILSLPEYRKQLKTVKISVCRSGLRFFISYLFSKFISKFSLD